jgi:hypothetical protein
MERRRTSALYSSPRKFMMAYASEATRLSMNRLRTTIDDPFAMFSISPCDAIEAFNVLSRLSAKQTKASLCRIFEASLYRRSHADLARRSLGSVTSRSSHASNGLKPLALRSQQIEEVCGRSQQLMNQVQDIERKTVVWRLQSLRSTVTQYRQMKFRRGRRRAYRPEAVKKHLLLVSVRFLILHKAPVDEYHGLHIWRVLNSMCSEFCSVRLAKLMRAFSIATKLDEFNLLTTFFDSWKLPRLRKDAPVRQRLLMLKAAAAFIVAVSCSCRQVGLWKWQIQAGLHRAGLSLDRAMIRQAIAQRVSDAIQTLLEDSQANQREFLSKSRRALIKLLSSAKRVNRKQVIDFRKSAELRTRQVQHYWVTCWRAFTTHMRTHSLRHNQFKADMLRTLLTRVYNKTTAVGLRRIAARGKCSFKGTWYARVFEKMRGSKLTPFRAALKAQCKLVQLAEVLLRPEVALQRYLNAWSVASKLRSLRLGVKGISLLDILTKVVRRSLREALTTTTTKQTRRLHEPKFLNIGLGVSSKNFEFSRTANPKTWKAVSKANLLLELITSLHQCGVKPAFSQIVSRPHSLLLHKVLMGKESLESQAFYSWKLQAHRLAKWEGSKRPKAGLFRRLIKSRGRGDEPIVDQSHPECAVLKCLLYILAAKVKQVKAQATAKWRSSEAFKETSTKTQAVLQVSRTTQLKLKDAFTAWKTMPHSSLRSLVIHSSHASRLSFYERGSEAAPRTSSVPKMNSKVKQALLRITNKFS